MIIRNPDCDLCPLSAEAEGKDRCVTFVGSAKADFLFVTKTPLGPKSRSELEAYLKEAGYDLSKVAFTGATKCKVWGAEVTKSDIKTCRSYLEQEVLLIRPKVIVPLGNEALLATSGNSGIMKYRGRTLVFKSDSKIEGVAIPTVAPAMISRNPGQRSGFIADLTYIRSTAYEEPGGASERSTPRIRIVTSYRGFEALRERLRRAEGIAFDVETNGFNEWLGDSALVTLALTCWDSGADAPADVWVLPCEHPDSPWKGEEWKTLIKALANDVRGKKLIAHNGKFDLRWLEQFGWEGVELTFDTMFAAHLLDENRPKGLKPLARTLLGVAPWDMSTKDLMSEDLRKVCKYNALDTWYTARLYFQLREELKKQPRLAALMMRVMVPASNALVPIERRGIWVNREKMIKNSDEVDERLRKIEDELMSYVPAEWPDDLGVVNFNTSNFCRWWLFVHLKLPVIVRGKSGNPSMAEAVLERIQVEHPHPVVGLLLERAKWFKTSTAFFNAYKELIDDHDRIHTTFKLTGTVTGRLSSGKGDNDKVTGRVQNRGVNLQQVPRDKLVRGIFGAPPGSVFVECDYSQIELRVAAFVARESSMLDLYRTGQDIHQTMAMRLSGKSADQIDKEERKKAKSVNFGFLYGMGWRKYVSTAWENYGVQVSEAEAQAFRVAFFQQFPGLQGWHARQRRLAHKYKRVETPLGRVRHLPDIDSPEDGVRGEAERQAINSPVQGFASDLTVLSLVTLTKLFRKRGLSAHCVGTVHDAILYEVPEPELAVTVPLMRKVMENLPLDKWFGVRLDVPIVADAGIGQYWGGATELPGEISSSTKEMRVWMKQNLT